MKDGAPFGIAGIWENWKDPTSGEWIRTFAIITTDANELVADIHDRMPVILSRYDYARWLSEETDPRDLMRPFPAEPMRMWPISTRVNKPENDDPPFVNYAERSRRLHHQPAGRLTWIRAWKTAFASAPMRCGPHMAACTVKPSSTGLRPNGKCWRHRRPYSPANQVRRRSHGRPHVRRPPERSRGPADAAHHIRDARACSAAISTLIVAFRREGSRGPAL